MTARDDLLAALTAERLDVRWFAKPSREIPRDDEVTCARRRRELLDDDMAEGRWVTRRGVQVWEAAS